MYISNNLKNPFSITTLKKYLYKTREMKFEVPAQSISDNSKKIIKVISERLTPTFDITM